MHNNFPSQCAESHRLASNSHPSFKPTDAGEVSSSSKGKTPQSQTLIFRKSDHQGTEDKAVLTLCPIKHVLRSILTFTDCIFSNKSFNKIDIDMIARMIVKSFMICTARSNADIWNFATHKSVPSCQTPQKTIQ